MSQQFCVTARVLVATSLIAGTSCHSGGSGGNGDSGIATSANSIEVSTGGSRNDPEGVAPPADHVSVITWKDSRLADRTLVLGAYLYQYDFSFDDNTQVVTRSANDDAYGHEGFGYVVSHHAHRQFAARQGERADHGGDHGLRRRPPRDPPRGAAL
ncbi:MAG: hypothetical protein U1E76_19080 [Planctomycetota bacterium]